MSLTAKIIEIIPDVEYEGVVYEQRVVVALPTDTQIGLFDYDLHATSDMVGTKRQLSILAYMPTEVDVVMDSEPGIEPSNSESAWLETSHLSWSYHAD